MKRVYLVAIVVLLLVVVLAFFISGRDEGRDEEAAISTPAAEGDEKVFLYFTARDGRHLVATSAEIDSSAERAAKVRRVFDLLRQGPGEEAADLLFPVLPAEASLKNVYLDKEGCLYLSLGAEILEGHPRGSSAEKLSIYAVVNSMVESFSWVSSVRFLLEGEEMDTLAGHVNLSGKLVTDNDIIVLLDETEEARDVDRELERDVIR